MSHRLRLAGLAGGVATIAIVVFFTVSRSPENVRDIVRDAGAWAPMVFIPLSAALSCAFFPGQLLAGASGLLFGTAVGTPITIIGATLAAACAFSISRHGGRAALNEISGPRIHAWQDRIERGGFWAVLYARIAPLSPFVVVNYVAGLTRLRLTTFLLATVIGIAPRSFAYTALGGHLNDLGSPEAIVAFAILAVMAVVGGFLVWNGSGRPAPRTVWRILRRRRSAGADA